MMLASHSMEPGSSFLLPEQTCQRFTLAEIQSATNSFDKTLVIGHGGFGTVYKCVGKVGTCVSEVAVKRLDSKSKQGATEFEAEVKILSKLRHGNLFPLVGYCHEGGEMLLAYEFMPNGTLKSYLCKADSELSWLQRIKICVGVARGLGYLHTGISTQHGVIHRDVKTSNILLDANFDAKISDFGLDKVGPIDRTQTYVSTDLKGTCGYLDPSCWGTQKLTRKSDVYAFGVVLMEVLSGRQALDLSSDDEPLVLADWARDQIKKGKTNQMIDTRLKGQISKRCLKQFIRIAGKCLHIRPKQRPTMANIVDKLESILTQERERANSVVAERRFIYNIRCFLWGKGVMIPDNALGSKSVMPNPAIERKFVLNDGTGESKSALGIQSVSKEGVVGSKSTMPHGAVGRTSVWKNCAVGIKYVMHLGSVSKIMRNIHEGTKTSKKSMRPVFNTMSLKQIRPQSGVFFPGYKSVKRIFKFARTVTRPKYYLGCVAATRSENRIGEERRKSVSYGSRLMPRDCIYTGKHTSV